MANLTVVTLAAGVPTAGDGTVSTLDALVGAPGSPSPNTLTVQGAVGGTVIPVSFPSPVTVQATTPLPVEATVPLPVSAPSPLPVSAPSPLPVDITNTPLPVVLSNSLPASAETSTIYEGTTALTPEFVPVAANTSGINVVVSPLSGKRIRVLALMITAQNIVNIRFQTSGTGGDITGNFFLPNAGQQVQLPFNPVGWFQTNSGEGLNIFLSLAAPVGGVLVYVAV